MKFIRSLIKMARWALKIAATFVPGMAKVLSRKSYTYLDKFTIRSKQKEFRRGQNKVILIGMMHIADAKFYDSLKEDFKNTKALAFEEGVSDALRLVKKTFGYGDLAETVGLKGQPKNIFPNGIRADVDLSILSSKTIKFLKKIGPLMEILHPKSVAKMLSGDRKLKNRSKRSAKLDMSEYMGDILSLRNHLLYEKVCDYLRDHEDAEIIIPWGAAHLPEIEAWLLRDGFKFEQEKTRPVLNLLNVVILYGKSILVEVKILKAEKTRRKDAKRLRTKEN